MHVNEPPDLSRIQLCALADIPDAGALELEHEGDSLVLLRYGLQAYAYLNVCPHAGRPLNWAPGRFLVAHGQLVCASHGAAFKAETGECIGGPCKGSSLRAFKLEVDDLQVYLRVEA
jgi:nitrite reductase/ring-hydroxylating ferredoxin subunit